MPNQNNRFKPFAERVGFNKIRKIGGRPLLWLQLMMLKRKRNKLVEKKENLDKQLDEMSGKLKTLRELCRFAEKDNNFYHEGKFKKAYNKLLKKYIKLGDIYIKLIQKLYEITYKIAKIKERLGPTLENRPKNKGDDPHLPGWPKDGNWKN